MVVVVDMIVRANDVMLGQSSATSYNLRSINRCSDRMSSMFEKMTR